MKTLQSNFTTPAQSNRLLELGVPADSADCYYGKDGKIHHIDGSIPNSLLWTVGCIPCWSAGRLMEIVDICCKWNLYEDWLKYRISDETIGIPIEHIVSTLEYLSSDNSIDFSKLEE